MAVKTTATSYWINWRFLVCVMGVLVGAIFSSLLIWRREGLRKSRKGITETQPKTPGTLYEDETWRPCVKGIHPAWLLAYRVFAFFVLLALLILSGIDEGGIEMLLFYTQCTFTLVTFYFALGSVLSIHGCYQLHKKASGGNKVENVDGDSEQGISDASALQRISNASNHEKSLGLPEEHLVRQPAGTWGYIFQIIFQMSAGAVTLTDSVFWFILVPLLAMTSNDLGYVTICMHSVNAIFLLGDAVLNALRFPWFRIAYFFLWTLAYVVYQWIVHASVDIWWPYPFLGLASRYAPIWYFSVALFHFPCYGIFALLMKIKHYVLSSLWPESAMCTMT